MARSLEERLREVEDRLEIYNLIAGHPPSADTGSGDYTRRVWAEDGTFDRGAQFPRPTGRDAIAAASSNPEHHRALEQGIAHVSSHPYVRVTGDRASAISYLQILVPDRVGPTFDVPNHGAGQGFHIHRVSANRWDFERTPEGWKIKSRTLRPLDGTPEAREILKAALGD
jgi:hypothetical protein